MRLLSITLCKFGSFRDEVTFTFPDGPGLFFLRGDNRAEPALEANGAGKSTLWNAICWVAFDRTVKGLRAGDVANWDDPKGAFVSLTYATDHGVFRITRQHSPNRWVWDIIDTNTINDKETVDLTKGDSNIFLHDLQLGLEPFLNCVLMGQGRPMFLDLEAGKKAELFSDVLGLDVWLERSKRAGMQANEQDAVLRTLERRLADVDGQLRSIDVASLNGNAKDWEAEHDRRLAAVEGRHAAAVRDYRDKKEQLTATDAKLVAERDKLKTVAARLEQTRDDLKRAERNLQKVKSDADALKRYISDKQDDIRALSDLADCPTCRQKVPHEHRDRVSLEMDDALAPKQRELADLLVTIDNDADHLKNVGRDYVDDEDAVLAANQRLAERQQDVRRLEQDIGYLNKDLDRLEDDAQRIHDERNPFASMRQEVLDREEQLQALRRHTQRLLDDAQARMYLLNYWAKGFKEIRLQLINDSLQQLEIEANSNLDEVGLHGWELRFDVDKETASGNVTRGFNVTVKSPHNDRPVPWKAWSGGEGQRLRVAAQEGLADLIRVRTGATLNLEVWDEPTEHLSGQGVVDLLDSLATRAQREQRQIWVVDHRSLGYGAFTDVYTIVKDDNGSHFEGRQ